ncbi:MAG: hypothetical protein ABWZ39_08535 [Pseudomonas caspiana]
MSLSPEWDAASSLTFLLDHLRSEPVSLLAGCFVQDDLGMGGVRIGSQSAWLKLSEVMIAFDPVVHPQFAGYEQHKNFTSCAAGGYCLPRVPSIE